ncbi:uncharacterized protein LOC111706344 isoform X2 [Eurytemora carolleeae]|uniref:uncharacterized protein LOC111706344 isoform X2 n=1 Tax=Eurytemora carolleeae TaxID=1294199 RepID=UPI000C77B13A|nr:uncharacterized protein LOC111706344 isoform X2 [Eurytemora carolleeae]|eukprot:XP_023334962.1 uncharacterized protein LOC111706344 isoform X2 [Eurytemora affinis]
MIIAISRIMKVLLNSSQSEPSLALPCPVTAPMNLFTILISFLFLFVSIDSKQYLVQTLDDPDLEAKPPSWDKTAYAKNSTQGDDYGLPFGPWAG